VRARAGALALAALALAAGALAGCATSYAGDSPKQVQQWAAAAPYDADNAQIQSDLGDLANGLAEHQLQPLKTACEAFSIDVDTLYTTLPTPDTTVTDELNAALSTWGRAAEDCYGAPSFSSARFAKYRAELKSARAEYAKAQRRLRTFGVK
jgi:hypothetical protein